MINQYHLEKPKECAHNFSMKYRLDKFFAFLIGQGTNFRLAYCFGGGELRIFISMC